MEAAFFEAWLGAIVSLSEAQRQRAFEALALSEGAITAAVGSREPAPAELAGAGASGDATAAAAPSGMTTISDLGQRKVAITGCPHCGEAGIVRWGASSGLPRYRCKACARTFNALTKTPLARLRMREKWSTQADAMIDGVSVAKAARRCGVHYTTAFRWRHRFLAALIG
jgi:transposase-like protein